MEQGKTNKEHPKDLSAAIAELKSDVISYLNNRIAYYKLDFIERLSKTISLLTVGIISSLFAFLFFCFILVSIAFYLGELLGSNALGFCIMALVWLFLGLLVVIFRNPLKDFLLNRIVNVIYNLQKENDVDLDDIDNEDA